MAMHANGRSKLTEECGEVLQVVGKLNSYPSGKHPDGGPNLYERLEDELADLSAAIEFVTTTHGLDRDRMSERQAMKLERFKHWSIEVGA